MYFSACRPSIAVAIMCLVILNAEVKAQQTTESQNTDKVVIQVERSDLSGQREIFAGKIVLGREWLERTAASTIAEALRRESSVTIQVGGKVSLKGLAGYTRILLDGQTATGGLNPLDMDPALIERVEIIHSAEAASGVFGLAGTINVVTRNRRKPLPTQSNLSISGNGMDSTQRTSLQSGWRDHSGATFNVSLEYAKMRSSQLGEANWEWMYEHQQQRKSVEITRQNNRDQSLSVLPSFSWKPTSQDELQVKTSFLATKSGYENGNFLLTGSSYEDGGIRPQESRMADLLDGQSVSLNGQWRHKFENEGALTVQLKVLSERQMQDRTANTIWWRNLINQIATKHESKAHHSRSQTIYTLPNLAGHRTQVGLSEEFVTQVTDQDTLINDIVAQGAWLNPYRANLSSIDRAFWVQDDWNVSETLDIKLGLRQEYRHRQWTSVGFDSKHGADLLAPSINFSHRLGVEAEHTFSAGFARSFAPIGAGMLGMRPDIAGTSLCASKEICGYNDPNQPDRMGNPGLKYESAWGLDLALEGKWKEHSQWNVRAYHRWIKDTLLWLTQRENVAWANVPRWVNRPVNRGGAEAYGASVGFDTNLDDWMNDAPDLEMNVSVQWNSSRLGNLPMPDNRIEGQQPWSGRAGLTYKAEHIPLEIQTDLLLNPSHWWQASIDRRIYVSNERDISAKFIWTFSPQRKLIFSLQNLNPISNHKVMLFSGEPMMQLRTRQRQRTSIAVRFEMQLGGK